MRFLVFLIVFAFSSQSFAAPCTQYRATDSLSAVSGEWSASPEAAVSSLFSKLQTVWYGPGSCKGTISYSAPTITATSFSYKGTYGGCSGGPSPTSGSGTIASRVDECEDTVCKSQQGQETVVNFTVGYTRTPNIDADLNWKLVGAPNKIPSSGLLCNPSSPCALKFSGFSDNDKAWQSASPTPNGLYRVSLDVSASYTGDTCTPTEVDNAALNKTAPIPPCPGFTGEVNGVPGCYGTASNPTSNDKPEPKPKQPEAGNPSAGEKPATGEGSGSGGQGRTPSTGDGGPAGGPAAAAGSGTKPDGTTPKPDEGKEQANCGAPGQPRCQIDESGTPNGGDSKDRLIDAVNKAGDDQKAAIENASKLKADGWTFSFALPSGCTALTLAGYQIPGQGALSIDVCKWQPMIHDVMTMLWLIFTVWGCINMVGSTLRGS